jgi:hypothetical protein
MDLSGSDRKPPRPASFDGVENMMSARQMQSPVRNTSRSPRASFLVARRVSTRLESQDSLDGNENGAVEMSLVGAAAVANHAHDADCDNVLENMPAHSSAPPAHHGPHGYLPGPGRVAAEGFRPSCGEIIHMVQGACMTVLLVTYILVGVKAGTTSGKGSLKEVTHCCAPQHVVFGAVGWWFPPLFLFMVFYQIADHYGFWWPPDKYTFGPAVESWTETFSDLLEYLVGCIVCYAVRWVRPVRPSCVSKMWRHWRRTGRCLDTPPFCLATLCARCVDPYVRSRRHSQRPQARVV